MEFRWIPWNIDKVLGHGVTPEEAEEVIRGAAAPYPQYRQDDRLLVWGPTTGGRLLQSVYVLDEDGTTFVIHARPLTETEKHGYRRHRRRRGL